MNIKIFLLALILFTSCANTKHGNISNPDQPTEIEINSLNYGQPPSGYEMQFKKTIKENLKDPDSALFKNISEPFQMWQKTVDIHHYWLICGDVNSKNSFGGYTGFKTMGVRYYFKEQKYRIESLGELGTSKGYWTKYRQPCLKK